MGYGLSTMPRKVDPASDFGRRLLQLRTARGLTQTQLAEAIGSSQRAISHYETVAEYPPPPIIIELAKALGTTTDELLGLKKRRAKEEPPEDRRLWKKFRQVADLPEKDQRAVIRLINSLTELNGLKKAS